MTPAARLAAAIEVLDQLAANSAPAEGALKAWGRANRFAGSGDRRAIGEQVFLCLREKGRLSSAMGARDGRALLLGALRLIDRKSLVEIAALFSGANYAPKALNSQERAKLETMADADGLGLPPFVEAGLRATFGEDWQAEAEALLRARAPVDIRANSDRASVEEVQAALPVVSVATPWSAMGLRLEGSADLSAFSPFQQGWFEIQDEGSQIAAFLAGGGSLVVDYCAGGGGKTLALATSPRERGEVDARNGRAGEGTPDAAAQTLILPQGEALRAPPSPWNGEGLIACDTDPKRLDAIRPRLARAGVKADLRELGPDGEGTADLVGQADLVLVDAPCSGSGTWRRRPEAAWRTSEGEIIRLAALQARIIANAAKLVRPGGRLAYVTCSVLAAENAAIVDGFAAAHPEFRPYPITEAARTPNLTDAARARLAALSGGGHTVQLSPLRTGTDGFYIALFQRTA